MALFENELTLGLVGPPTFGKYHLATIRFEIVFEVWAVLMRHLCWLITDWLHVRSILMVLLFPNRKTLRLVFFGSAFAATPENTYNSLLSDREISCGLLFVFLFQISINT